MKYIFLLTLLLTSCHKQTNEPEKNHKITHKEAIEVFEKGKYKDIYDKYHENDYIFIISKILIENQYPEKMSTHEKHMISKILCTRIEILIEDSIEKNQKEIKELIAICKKIKPLSHHLIHLISIISHKKNDGN